MVGTARAVCAKENPPALPEEERRPGDSATRRAPGESAMRWVTTRRSDRSLEFIRWWI